MNSLVSIVHGESWACATSRASGSEAMSSSLSSSAPGRLPPIPGTRLSGPLVKPRNRQQLLLFFCWLFRGLLKWKLLWLASTLVVAAVWFLVVTRARQLEIVPFHTPSAAAGVYMLSGYMPYQVLKRKEFRPCHKCCGSLDPPDSERMSLSIGLVPAWQCQWETTKPTAAVVTSFSGRYAVYYLLIALLSYYPCISKNHHPLSNCTLWSSSIIIGIIHRFHSFSSLKGVNQCFLWSSCVQVEALRAVITSLTDKTTRFCHDLYLERDCYCYCMLLYYPLVVQSSNQKHYICK